MASRSAARRAELSGPDGAADQPISAKPRMLPFAPALLLLVFGCDPPPTSIPPGEPPTVAPGPPPERPPPSPVPPSPVEEPADAGAPSTEPATPPPAKGGGGTSAAGAVGAACDSHADCETGICEGEGCGPKKGRCAARNRVCTRDRRAYCGCDGNTFHSSGSCPGARFSSRSACGGGGGGGGGVGAKLAADGARCKAAADCQSGICEGEGCGAASPGVCASRKRPCTADLRPFCGCDGSTFNASSSCPGRRYASRGACKK